MNKIDFDNLILSAKISKSKRLEKIFPSIEKCLLEGVSHLLILDQLNRDGFDINYATYRNMIHRIRKRTKLKENTSLPVKKIFGKKEENSQRTVEAKPVLGIGEPERYNYNKIVAEARANRVW
jgi:hypothetical protein